MAAIGDGWADGAWVVEAWEDGAWASGLPVGVGREAATTPFGGNQNNSATVDVGTKGNRFLVVHIAWYIAGSALPTTITYDGVALTEIITNIDNGLNQTSLWGIVNPSPGSNTLVVNWAVAPNEGPVITALPFFDVLQTSVAAALRDTAISGNAANGGSQITATLTGVIASDMSVGGVYNFPPTSGVAWDTVTEQSDAEFTGSSGTCEGSTGTDLAIAAVTATLSSNGSMVALALIYDPAPLGPIQIMDAILRATGGPTINDGLSAYFSRTANESVRDAEFRWLGEQGGTKSTRGDRWVEVFGPGDINDVRLAYWRSQ